jgi:DNA replication protein DnaC
MQTNTVVTTLKSLKLHGMADAIGELAQQQAPAYRQAEPILESLLKTDDPMDGGGRVKQEARAEVAEREVRSINGQMNVARFPAYRDLAGFDFTESTVDQELIKTLHCGDFINDAHNVVLIGGPGSGKTHLPLQSASMRSGIIIYAFAASQPSNSSICLNKKRRTANLGKWRIA